MNQLPVVNATGRPNSYSVEFESVGHAIAVSRSKGLSRFPGSGAVCDKTLRGHAGTPWVNHATDDSLDRWMREPQPALTNAVDEMRRRIESSIESPVRNRRKARHRQEDGEELDVQAVLERRLDAWTHMERHPVPKHVVAIGVNLTVSSYRRPADLLYRGAAAAALADLLTASGHSVEVVGFTAVNYPGTRVADMLLRVPVKAADIPMDMTSLSVALSEIGFFRMVMMINIGRCMPGLIEPGFGTPRSLTQEESRGLDVVLDANICSQQSAEHAVKEAMTKFKAAVGGGH